MLQFLLIKTVDDWIFYIKINHNSGRNKFLVSKGILITKGILVAYLVSLKP